jgi:hypothetical protein
VSFVHSCSPSELLSPMMQLSLQEIGVRLVNSFPWACFEDAYHRREYTGLVTRCNGQGGQNDLERAVGVFL